MTKNQGVAFIGACCTWQKSLVGSSCGLPAAISSSYRDIGVPRSVIRAFSVAGLELATRLPARSFTFLWQLSPGAENFSVLVLLAYTAHERLCGQGKGSVQAVGPYHTSSLDGMVISLTYAVIL